ncbi:DAK2 domain-containing protein [Lapidilactobacillus achengensis]|uniref:DAK2 domain-containing protein n=1 Tax=Lapidilactobacillus achengensis TaxID=2486000 RepID=A0ABW1USG3_9LACO|nr:DAK2 domain-containing protein [Lapidilactobacillus achengensis]
MELKEIRAKEFQDMVRVAAHRLGLNADFVNSLNVFPVPDGDTGTNMNLTVKSGAKAVNESNATDVGTLAKAFAKGLLMGARGNSGVITSQLFRGFAKSMEHKETLNAQDVIDAFTGGVQTAYQAVMKPVEGTILTVAREAAKGALLKAKKTDDIIEIMRALVESSKKSLANTPNLLPVLKEVGVVDSGGQGLVFIYEGFLEGLSGETAEQDVYVPDEQEMDEMVNATHHQSAQSHLATADIVNGYCTEMMIELGKDATTTDQFDYNDFRQHLSKIGDSLLVVADDEVVKVHVHTENPGEVLGYGQRYGALEKIKIDNMRIQHETIIDHDEAEPEEAKEWGIVAIAAGEGVADLFRSLGATYVLSGGQTMNPSTQDIADAIKATKAEKVIVLPNNGNILLAAQQAAEVVDAKVAIVASKSISQGMTSLLSFNGEASLEENQSEMTAALATVKSGSITQAIRDTEIDGLQIHKDHFMGIVDGKIIVDDPDRQTAAIQTALKMLDEDSEIVTLIVGQTGDETEAQAVADAITAQDDAIEVEIHEGDQPVYPYLIAVE